MDTKKKDPVEPGLSVNAERKLSCIGAERRRSLGVEVLKFADSMCTTSLVAFIHVQTSHVQVLSATFITHVISRIPSG